MPRRTHAADRRRPQIPNHRQADHVARILARTSPRAAATRLSPDAAGSAYAPAAAPAVDLVPCLEESARPGLLVVRFRPVSAVGLGPR